MQADSMIVLESDWLQHCCTPTSADTVRTNF